MGTVVCAGRESYQNRQNGDNFQGPGKHQHAHDGNEARCFMLVKDVIAFVAEYLYFGIVVAEGLYVLLLFRSRWKELLGAALSIGLIAFVLSLIANRIIEDPRPFVVSGVRPLIHSSVDNGFPSDHTLLLATTAAIIMTVSRGMGLLGLVAALGVGLARVYAGVHHIEDVLGSLAIAAIAFGAYQGLVRAWSSLQRHLAKLGSHPTRKS